MPIIIPRLDDPASASADERDEHLMLLEAARHSLDVEWAQTLGAAEAAGDHEVMGYPSMVAYLKHRMRMAGGRAHRYVRDARAVLKFPATFTVWKQRQISTDEAELMFQASERLPDKYPEAERHLLELVGDGVDETRRLLDYWRSDVDLPTVRLEIEEQLQRRHFDVTRRANGMVAGEFALPQIEGESLLTALDALMPPPDASDSRTTSQRRADALGDLARSFLEGSESPIVGGERPHINVHVDIPALKGLEAGSTRPRTGSCSPRSSLDNSPVTPRSHESCLAPAPKCSTWVARPGSFPLGSAGRWSPVTVTVSDLAAGIRPDGAMFTISFRGRTAARRPSTISVSSAAITTRRCTSGC
jgi:hypothetical protein